MVPIDASVCHAVPLIRDYRNTAHALISQKKTMNNVRIINSDSNVDSQTISPTLTRQPAAATLATGQYETHDEITLNFLQNWMDPDEPVPNSNNT